MSFRINTHRVKCRHQVCYVRDIRKHYFKITSHRNKHETMARHECPLDGTCQCCLTTGIPKKRCELCNTYETLRQDVLKLHQKTCVGRCAKKKTANKELHHYNQKDCIVKEDQVFNPSKQIKIPQPLRYVLKDSFESPIDHNRMGHDFVLRLISFALVKQGCVLDYLSTNTLSSIKIM